MRGRAGTSKTATTDRRRVRRSMVIVAMLGGLLPLITQASVGPPQRAAALAAASTYCDTVDTPSGDPIGPDDNGGGTPVDVTVTVVDVETHDPVPEFSYLVNLDNTARADDPDPLRHASLHHMASSSPVVEAGDQDVSTFSVPDGCRYLVSVRAPGYKLWGQHLDLLAPVSDTTQAITIELLADQQVPLSVPPAGDDTPIPGLDAPREGLPLSNLVVHVFEDVRPVNGFPDVPQGDVLPGDHGLAGFHIVVEDTIGETVVDFGGSPLCADSGHFCQTDANGDLTITGLPFGKYIVSAIPPDGTDWVQNSTFEGTRTVDAWLEEGADGLGAIGELLIEPGANTAFFFGFTRPQDTLNHAEGVGDITGRAVNFLVTPPFEDSVPQPNEPIDRPWIAVNHLSGNDEVVYVAQGNPDGTFTIPDVPAGTYQFVVWDDPLDYIIGFYTVVVETDGVDMGDVGVFRWFGWVSGFVYLDNGKAKDGTTITTTNSIDQNDPAFGVPAGVFARNGIRDCYDPNPAEGITPDPFDYPRCEQGLPLEEVLIKFRDGSVSAGTVTDSNGWYELPEARGPLGRFEVAEVGFGRRARTGHSVHQDFNFDPATPPNPPYDPYLSRRVPGDAGGDLLLSQASIEGHRSWIDWGKDNYVAGNPDENGGIAGAVLYATTRNEFDPRLAAQEDYEFGLPGVTVRMWRTNGTPSDQSDDFLAAEIQTDAWTHPTDPGNDAAGDACTLRDNLGIDLPDPNDIGPRCLEVPMNANETHDGLWDGGWAIEDDCSAAIAAVAGGPIVGDDDDDGDGIKNRDEPPGTLFDAAAVEALGCAHITAAKYVVEVEVPEFFQLVKEEDQNTDEGVAVVPQIPPPACVGDLHLVNDPRNPANGQMKPLCDRKLVTLQANQNAAAEFYLFTECDDCGVENPETGQRWDTQESVPLPGRFSGLVEDDLAVNTDPNSITYGEPRGVPNTPIGIYDFTGRRITTVYSDEHGFYEVLLPSSYTALCPIPSGVCPGMYVLVINDPGTADNPDPAWRPSHVTEPLALDIWPGKMTVADTPLDPINRRICRVTAGTPEIMRVSDVYLDTAAAASLELTITGTEFENPPVTVGGPFQPPTVTLDGTPLPVVSWEPSDGDADPPVYEDVVTVTVDSAVISAGEHQLLVSANGSGSRAGLTFHVLGGSYTPAPIHVNGAAGPGGDGSPGNPFDTIQGAVDAADPGDLVVVEPGTYRENVILHKLLKLQGFGPGGIVGNPEPDEGLEFPTPLPLTDPPFDHIEGSVIDGRFYQFDAARHDAWHALLGTFTYDPALPAPDFPGGAGITVAVTDGEFTALPGFDARVDGLGLTGARGNAGGGIYAHGYARNLQVSNNFFESNTSRHGGAVALGRPVVEGGLPNPPASPGGPEGNENDGVRMHHNRMIENGGFRFAGGVGIFAGADDYEFDHNDVCANFASEYGGGISHWGLSPNGSIHDNQVYFNDAFDEGGGIMVSGDPIPSAPLGTGSGAVSIERNVVLANLSNDDGGGIRILRALEDRIDIVNNMIIENIAADVGGGIALDDASDVTVVNNTIASNKTTATAEDADRTSCYGLGNPSPHPLASCPHGAGLTSETHSAAFTPSDGSTFSDAVAFNNIFWNNLALFYTLLPPEPDENAFHLGLVAAEDAPFIDLEVVFGGPGACFDPRNSILSVDYGPDAGGCTTTDPSNLMGADPLFVQPLTEIGIIATPGRDGLIYLSHAEPEHIAEETLAEIDFHLLPASPAIDLGVATFGGVDAPTDDFDGDSRPQDGAWDAGADETPGEPPAIPVTLLSFADAATVGAVVAADEDIVAFDGTDFTLFFQGADVGLGGVDVTALQVVDADTILLAFDKPITLPGVGNVTRQDIVQFDATSLGTTTAGTWSWYFDGSDVELTTSAEAIDAFEVTGAQLLVSTAGRPIVTGVTGAKDADLLAFTSTSLGPTTAGTWSMWFDGSDVGLTQGAEDIDGVSIRATGEVLLSTLGAFAVAGRSGGGEDVFVCGSLLTGPVTSCTYDPNLFFDGSAHGLTTSVDAVEFVP